MLNGEIRVKYILSNSSARFSAPTSDRWEGGSPRSPSSWSQNNISALAVHWLERRWLLLLFSRLVVPISMWPHGLRHTRLFCPPPSPRVCSNSCLLSQWCYLTISSSATHFSSCPQSFPASGSFPVSQLFTSSGQSTGASVSASVLPTNIHSWFPLGLTSLISLLYQGLSRVFSNTKFESIGWDGVGCLSWDRWQKLRPWKCTVLKSCFQGCVLTLWDFRMTFISPAPNLLIRDSN